MNNVTFGNKHYQYYETVAGGMGAGPGFNGCSAVQTHMTNSTLTDPEVLEERFPVVLERFAIRTGSGGQGQYGGGDGVIRQLRFLEPMAINVLSNNRDNAPLGICGGQPGQSGRNYIIRANGQVETLAANGQAKMNANDCFVIETPGGGGFGSAAPKI